MQKYEVLSDKRSLTYKVTLVLSSKEGAAKKIHRKSLALRESAHGGPCVDAGRILDIKSAGRCDRSDSGRQEFKRHPGMTLCIQGRPLRRQVWNLLEGGLRSSHLGCVETTGSAQTWSQGVRQTRGGSVGASGSGGPEKEGATSVVARGQQVYLHLWDRTTRLWARLLAENKGTSGPERSVCVCVCVCVCVHVRVHCCCSFVYWGTLRNMFYCDFNQKQNPQTQRHHSKAQLLGCLTPPSHYSRSA